MELEKPDFAATVETFGVSIHFEKGGEWVSKNRVNQPHDQVS